MEMSLTADHITYKVPKLPIDHNNIRLWAIQKQFPQNEAEYQSACTMALYWYYHTQFGCVYNAAVQRKIDALRLSDI